MFSSSVLWIYKTRKMGCHWLRTNRYFKHCILKLHTPLNEILSKYNFIVKKLTKTLKNLTKPSQLCTDNLKCIRRHQLVNVWNSERLMYVQLTSSLQGVIIMWVQTFPPRTCQPVVSSLTMQEHWLINFLSLLYDW